MEKSKNIGGLFSAIDLLYEDAEKNPIDESKIKLSLSEVIYCKIETIEFLLTYYKKKGGGGYKGLSKHLSDSGFFISATTLTTTINRVRNRIKKENDIKLMGECHE